MARFQKLRDSAYKSALGSNYLEQGKYAEALASTGAEPEAVDAKTPAVSLVEKDEAPPRRVDGRPRGPRRRRGARRGRGRARRAARAARRGGPLADVTEKAGLAGVAALAAVAGDYDNDGLRTCWSSARAACRSSATRAAGASRTRPLRSRPGRTPRRPPPSWTSTTTATSTSSWRAGEADGPGLVLQNNGDDLHRHHGGRAARRGRRGGRGRADRLRQPARRRPLRPEARPPRALQEHARRQLRGPGGGARARRHGAVPQRRRRRREQGRLHRLLPRGEGRVLARAQRRPRGVPGRARAAGGGGRARRAARGLRQRRPPRPPGGHREGAAAPPQPGTSWADVSAPAFAAPAAGQGARGGRPRRGRPRRATATRTRSSRRPRPSRRA